ncbi:helix-turn-helix transcriptional regulator [Pectinatus frisingensis]|uniref:helix-turn-helix transcriptional regulator n=1 Tax=Pectinatus frisingensis TaxID=865 RepID=UPI001E29C4EE|nr:helix-turn-helix transcriptional regulator [Pectinatus frisingensis]
MPKSENKLIIMNQLHVFCAEQRLTQAQLAESLGITRATIIAIEGENYNPSLELAFRIADFFKTDINSIFWIKENDHNEKI